MPGINHRAGCCCNSPGYRLTQCYIICSPDCNGSATVDTTPALSGLNDSYIGKIILYDSKCWTVSALASVPGLPTNIIGLYTGKYANCAACCDPCYTCGDCEFHRDSTVDVDYYWWDCTYTEFNCGGDLHDDNRVFAYRIKGTGLVRNYGCCGWIGDCDLTYYYRQSGQGCAFPAESQGIYQFTSPYRLSYDSTTNLWDTGDLGGLTYEPFSISDCAGGTETVQVLDCMDEETTGSAWEKITITVNNNDECNPLP